MKYKLLSYMVLIIMLLLFNACSTFESNGNEEIGGTECADYFDDKDTNKHVEDISASEFPYIFYNEKELADAVKSKTKDAATISSLTEFYRTKSTRSDISLTYITVKDFYIALRYEYNDVAKQVATKDTYFLIEWYRTMKEGQLEEDMSRNYPAESIRTYKHYYIINADTLQDVFWEENGHVFHAVTPSNISATEMEDFCSVEKVVIE